MIGPHDLILALAHPCLMIETNAPGRKDDIFAPKGVLQGPRTSNPIYRDGKNMIGMAFSAFIASFSCALFF